MAKELRFSEEARGHILKGVNILANAVRVTMIWKAGSKASTKVRVALVYGD